MNEKIVIANWKMHGTRVSNHKLINDLLPALQGMDGVKVAICPPMPYLAQLADLLGDTTIALGAQNISERAQGAFTGEVSGQMLADLGCGYALVGHSERRSLYGETDAQVAMKFEAALRAGLIPVLCLGETIYQRRAGNTNAVIGSQLKAVLEQVGIEQLAKGVIAYEPVWAIGTGETASPEQAQAVHQHIRHSLAAKNPRLAARMPLLYGGSVKAENAAQLFAQKDIDGGLIGGASLDADAFGTICQAARI
ncbi:triosephosphate isomerase [Pseudomonas sp. 10-1B]|uniref:triose-phosphate isomerase n=1 Tax=Pseudomonas sp. 10-1B TaxID=1546029 RepID=UPI00061FC651|nr:triose-phosphate isomerase [Pseudomonas sp. 10-1B]KIY41261.1 triosephosphate isomerase [Pseudomonas sp. 10-1B]